MWCVRICLMKVPITDGKEKLKLAEVLIRLAVVYARVGSIFPFHKNVKSIPLITIWE